MSTSPSGYILWQGPSAFDGKPIVAIVTGFNKSRNRKTGNMLQCWIIRSDVNPIEATRYGKDASVCGRCKHRPTSKYNPKGMSTCYVHVPNAPQQVYNAYKRGNYRPFEHSDWLDKFAGKRVRFGAYGDPTAVPFEIWQRIASACDHHTSYTHAWTTCDQRFRSLCMASVDTPEEFERAKALGWRCFRVRMVDEPLTLTERVCPASEEAGKKANCESCMACHGGGSQKASVAITIHGSNWQPAKFVQIRTLQRQHKAYLPLLAEALKNRKDKNRYWKHGYRFDVVRDNKGNVIKTIKTKINRELVGCS